MAFMNGPDFNVITAEGEHAAHALREHGMQHSCPASSALHSTTICGRTLSFKSLVPGYAPMPSPIRLLSQRSKR
jgi:hypothetical protein